MGASPTPEDGVTAAMTELLRVARGSDRAVLQAAAERMDRVPAPERLREVKRAILSGKCG